MASSVPGASTASSTLALLEWRLQRLEHYLGDPDEDQEEDGADDSGSDDTQKVNAVSTRLKRLEDQLVKISSEHSSVKEILRLRDRLPELFSDDENADADEKRTHDQHEISQQLAVVLASASEYSDMVSVLSSLQEYRVPDPKALVPIIAMEPRLRTFEATQDSQLRQINELRQRSAVLFAHWHQDHVLASGAAWSSLEDRLTHAERNVRREEAKRSQESDH